MASCSKVMPLNASTEQLEQEKTCVLQAVTDLSLDVIGSISSSLVFQPRATLTTSECIQALLESQHCLREHGSLEAWRPVVLQALHKGPFGCIENDHHLKDASGKFVEDSWHYMPSLDKDLARKASLEPFVKSVRGATKHRAQYYWRPIRPLQKRKW